LAPHARQTINNMATNKKLATGDIQVARAEKQVSMKSVTKEERAELTARDRFWRKVQKTESCWLWTGAVDEDGYGKLRFASKLRSAHRLSWEYAHGSSPGAQFVCHTCDTPRCVNPAHLFLGSSNDNNQDRLAKGRYLKGETHHLSTISDAAVSLMRIAYSVGFTQTQLRHAFAVSKASVSRIVRGVDRKESKHT
jgi:hypothetical protein